MELTRIFVAVSCRVQQKSAPGGWGIVIQSEREDLRFKHSIDMVKPNELYILAAIEAIGRVKDAQRIEMYTNSDYLCSGASNWIYKWRKNNWCSSYGIPIANEDSWRELNRVMSHRVVEWCLVKNKDAPPEMRDAINLAKEAAYERRTQG